MNCYDREPSAIITKLSDKQVAVGDVDAEVSDSKNQKKSIAEHDQLRIQKQWTVEKQRNKAKHLHEDTNGQHSQ